MTKLFISQGKKKKKTIIVFVFDSEKSNHKNKKKKGQNRDESMRSWDGENCLPRTKSDDFTHKKVRKKNEKEN